MNHTRAKVIVAALLHDIGKLGQRADGAKSYLNSIYLKDTSAGYAGSYCPTKKTGSGIGYQHVLWTAQFIENHKDRFRELGLWSEEEDSLLNLAAKHHKPEQNSQWQALISLADHWSSGIDRRKEEVRSEEEETECRIDQISWGTYAFRKIPLHSIFDTLLVNGNSSTMRHVFPLRPLSVDDPAIFEPQRLSKELATERDSDYRQLWDDFQDEFKAISVSSYSVYIESLLALLRKYTWCIPSSTLDMANVSLYDHMRMTAAIALCVYDYHNKYPDTLQKDGNYFRVGEKHFPLLLVQVDISGIQKFIYDIASSKAAKSLKGRSFYLQLLMDAIIREIYTHDAIQGSPVQTIYASGGKAFLLLPNTSEVKEALSSIHHTIEKNLWDDHELGLYMHITYQAFKPQNQKILLDNGSEDTLGRLWESVIHKADKEKLQRYQNLIRNDFNAFFNPNGLQKGAKLDELCAVSGMELTRNNKATMDDDEMPVTKLVKKQISLGTALKDFDALVVKTGDRPPDNFSDYYIRPAQLSTHYYLASFADLKKKDQIRLGGSTVYGLNTTDLEPVSRDSARSFIFYGGNKMQEITIDGTSRARDFHDLADETYLGILRMDVDNLGKLFRDGFAPADRSLSAYSTLSFFLDLFFSGYLNSMRDKDNYRDHIQILYSGGDDLFVVGKWDKVIEFASEVNRSFIAFTGRPDLSISGGISILNKKFPIQKAAFLSGEEEKKAKSFVRSDGQQEIHKNAIAVFGFPVGWEEWPIVTELRKKLVAYIEERRIPNGILHRIQNFYIEKKNSKGSLRYKWLGVYQFARVLERIGEKDKDARQFIQDDIIRNLFHNQKVGADRYLDLACVAARWAELEIRFKEKK